MDCVDPCCLYRLSFTGRPKVGGGQGGGREEGKGMEGEIQFRGKGGRVDDARLLQFDFLFLVSILIAG